MSDDTIHVTYYPHRDTSFTPMPRALRLDPKISKNAKLLYLDLVALAQEQPIGKELTIARADLAQMEHTSAREITRNIRDLKAGHWLGVQKRYRLDQFKKAHQDVNGYAVFAEQADCENWVLDKCPIFISHDGQPCPPSKEGSFTPMGVHEGQGCPPELIKNKRDSSVFTNVHTEESHAEPSQAQVGVGHFSGKKEEAIRLYELREVLKHGHTFEEYYLPETVQTLIDLGEIERCTIDNRKALVLKGKCPQSHTDCNDPKVTELQTALQRSFLPGSDGNEPEKPVTPPPQAPPPVFLIGAEKSGETWDEKERFIDFAKAVDFAKGLHDYNHEVDYRVLDAATHREIWPLPLSGYEAKPTPPPAQNLHRLPTMSDDTPTGGAIHWPIDLEGSAKRPIDMQTVKPGDLVWWNPARNQRNLCGTQPLIRAIVFSVTEKRVQIQFKGYRDGCLHPSSVKPENLLIRQSSDREQWEITAANLAAKAAARAQGKGKKTDKPPLKQPSTDVKDALALLRHGGKEHMTGANWSALVKLWNQLECPPLDKIQKFAKWWAQDWRGKQGERPAHAIIISEWPTAMHWNDSNTEPVMHYADDGEDFPEVHLDDPV